VKLICTKTQFIAEQDRLTVFAALAEFIRTTIVANTNEDLDAASASGGRRRSPRRRSHTAGAARRAGPVDGLDRQTARRQPGHAVPAPPELKAAAVVPAQAPRELTG
jgi:DNA invertase Pin-like site-specific DNA recombinase